MQNFSHWLRQPLFLLGSHEEDVHVGSREVFKTFSWRPGMAGCKRWNFSFEKRTILVFLSFLRVLAFFYPYFLFMGDFSRFTFPFSSKMAKTEGSLPDAQDFQLQGTYWSSKRKFPLHLCWWLLSSLWFFDIFFSKNSHSRLLFFKFLLSTLYSFLYLFSGQSEGGIRDKISFLYWSVLFLVIVVAVWGVSDIRNGHTGLRTLDVQCPT